MLPWTPRDSILYNHLPKQDEQQDKQQTKNNQMKLNNLGLKLLPPLLSHIDNDPDFEFLRSNKEFFKLIEEYRGKCNKFV